MVKKLLITVILLLVPAPGFAQDLYPEWVRRYNGPGNSEDVARAIAIDGSGYVYVTGYSFGSGTDYDYATIKYKSNGDTAWVRRYNGPADSTDKADAIAVDGLGNVYVTGYSFALGTEYDYATIKYNPDGDTAWVRRYNGPGNANDYAEDVAVDNLGNVYVTGVGTGIGTGGDYVTLMYDPLGNLIGQGIYMYNGPGNWTDRAMDVEVDDYGNVYVTGFSSAVLGGNPDYATIKYGATGWTRRYDGPESGSDMAEALAVDGSGNVYVTGSIFVGWTTGMGDYGTIKYSPTGGESWVATYNGPGTGSDLAFDIGIDDAGNVYVTGRSPGTGPTGSSWDYATIKYDPAGTEKWARRYNGPGNDRDQANAIAVGELGAVCVTGESYGTETSLDYATLVYDSEGNELWVTRYNGTANDTDIAWDVEVAQEFGADFVYVTGESEGNGTGRDYVTIKYSPFWPYAVSSSRFLMKFNNLGNLGAAVDWEHGADTVHAGYGGSLILGTDPDNLACAYGSTCPKYVAAAIWTEDWLSFERTVPNQDPLVYNFSRHYTKFQHRVLPLEIELFAIGAFDPGGGPCEDALFVKYVIRNMGEDPIDNIKKALYLDLNIDPSYGTNVVEGFEEYSTMWAYHEDVPNILFGMIQTPVYEDRPNCFGGFGVSQPTWISPQEGWDPAQLDSIMGLGTWEMDPLGTQSEDIGIMLIDYPFSLEPGSSYCNEYILWAYDAEAPVNGLTLGQFLYELMKQQGYYRGNVDGDTLLSLTDVVYLINYTLKGGAAPKPFDDQGDVDCDGAAGVTDVVCLINYLFKGGQPPIDKNRFFPPEYQEMLKRTGLVADDLWRDLYRLQVP